MKRSAAVLLLAVALGACVLAGGWAATAKASGFLGDYSAFETGPGGIDLLYRSPDAPWARYDKVILEPVKVWIGGEPGSVDAHELKKLADSFERALREALQGDYAVLRVPAPDTVRVRSAITNVRPGAPVVHALTVLVPVGLVASTAKRTVTGEPLGVGEATIEMELVDAQTGERLVAAVDRQVGKKYQIVEGMSKWGHVEAAFRSWADRLKKALERARKGEMR